MNKKCARVSWETGQSLLPDHLVALEESLLADTMVRFRIQGLPCYGVAELTLNGALLSEGVLSIESLVFVTADGRLMLVPGNAAVESLNLSLTGKTIVHVYLHLVSGLPGDQGEETGWAEAGDGVKRRYHRLLLSADKVVSGAVSTFTLLEAVKSPEGFWTLSGETIPPLLQVGASPFLRQELSALTEALELFRYNLTMDSSSYLSGDSLYSVKQCLRSVFRTQRTLANIIGGVHLHPYYLYEEVQSLYADVCFYRNANPEEVTRPYDHDRPVAMKQAITRLIDQMQLVRSKPSYVSFARKDNLFRAELPEDIRQAVGVYLLVQKRSLAGHVAMESVKVAGELRLPFVHKMALHGIPLKRVERPSFQHTFGAEVEFYQVCESGEWDHALNEKSLAFLSRPDLTEADFYLYWRMVA